MPSPPTSAELHPLLARIAAHARAQPEATAVLWEGKSLSYARLWADAIAVAADLRAAGLVPGDRVAIRGERTPSAFVHILGVLIADGLYVPLGERAPPARQATILADSGARFVLSTTAADEAACERLHDDGVSGPAEPAGYILYTSGSTGQPKGVQITLDNVDAYVGHLRGAYPLAAQARAAQIADLGFDASAHEMFSAWSAGAALCVVPTRFVLMWPRYFRDLAIEEALLVPSQVRLADEARLLRSGALPALRRVFLGAELVTGHVARRMAEAAPGVELVNLWGPTEGTVALTHHRIDTIPPDHDGVPIGRPWTSQSVILDGDAPDTGEMIACGPQICRGYWRLPAADAAAFEMRDGIRFYHSGDLARIDAAGDYVFAGRRDRQIKIKGHRIELDECERAIRKHAGTDAAFVLAEDGALVCLLPDAIAIEPLAQALRAELPAYMVPARFVPVAAFPINASGKVDLAGLRALAAET